MKKFIILLAIAYLTFINSYRLRVKSKEKV